MVSRRTLLSLLAFLPSIPAAWASVHDEDDDGTWTAFDAAGLVERARMLASRPYAAPPAETLSPVYLDYDRYRSIRFLPERSLWFGEGRPFLTDFFHVGGLYRQPVTIHEVIDAKARPVPYDPLLFDLAYAEEAFPGGKGGGFAGLRLHHKLNDPKHFSEFALFLGASYFRAVGANLRYGLSARGIAIDAGEAEEFPDFTAFWVERPAPNSASIVVHALLDGPSVAGAYRFDITPGETTVMDVSASLFSRRRIAGIGLAPLTSMYMRGPLQPGEFLDFRPRVHDSDGLAIRTGAGREIWRPLGNPAGMRTTRFDDTNPRGFGLLQRPRTFERYLDLEARYDLRPSLWVEPLDDWGEGTVCLIEFPTPDEVQDNIVAFWQPARPAEIGAQQDVRYRLHWGVDVQPEGLYARVAGTYAGEGGLASSPDDNARKFVIDFAPGSLDTGAEDDEEVGAVVTASSGTVLFTHGGRNEATGGWRAFFDVRADEGQGIDLTCLIERNGEAVSETWTYRWEP